MNFMRKILNQRDEAFNHSDQDLSLMHLNKLFNELKTSYSPLTNYTSGSKPSKYDIQAHLVINEHEQKIYKLLPLFLKVFANANISSGNGSNIFNKFNDLNTFTGMVSRLMVTEIRRRASNKTTQEASENIINFLEIPSQECNRNKKALETSNNNSNDQKGWILLSTLNLLVCSGNSSLIPIMASSSLPSTLVKCLYLFFDLPQKSNENMEESSEIDYERIVRSERPDKTFLTESLQNIDENCERLSSYERRLILQRVFAQLLSRLCAHQSSLNELKKKDDLALLFNAVTSWCVPYNIRWRHISADVILMMSKNNCINGNYLHEKGCISTCIENMSRMSELPKSSEKEITDMLSTIINFLSNITQNNPSSANILLNDFKNSLGYHFIIDFCLKLEKNDSLYDNLKQIISLTTLFCKVGTTELKPRPLSVNQLFIMDDFFLPKPNSKQSIKNLCAFNVLQSLWFKAKTLQTQDLVLSSLFTLYQEDRANYFILDSQNTLSQFAEKLQLRDIVIQERFFNILEFVICELRYVPCKELISVSIIIKSSASVESSLVCLKSLLSIIKFNSIFRDVYREVGLLDIIINILINKSQQIFSNISAEDVAILELAMEITLNLLVGPNNSNCNLFKNAAGPKYLFSLLPQTSSKVSKQIRKLSFLIIQQLILSNNGEENLVNLLTLMHNSNASDPISQSNLTLSQELSLKSSILKILLNVLKESHRCRALFRKVGGFVYVMSVLVRMEGCLIEEEDSIAKHNNKQIDQWFGISKRKIWNLIVQVLSTLTTSMRFEPANARFFANEICPASLTDSLRLLGCFTCNKYLSDIVLDDSNDLNDTNDPNGSKKDNECDEIFYSSLSDLPPKDKLTSMESTCLILRLLYDMALDLFEKISPTHMSHLSEPSKTTTDANNPKRPNLSLNIANFPHDVPVIVHSSIVIVMFHLIPSIVSPKLQYYFLEKLRRLMRSERNQQVMCEAGLLSEILSDKLIFALLNEKHPLHISMQYILERLSAQNIQPKELKCFLRLGNPLNCLSFDEIHKSKDKYSNMKEGRPLSLSRIKTLVSMTTPKDASFQGLLHPPFVEFDMTQEGFSCLFLPSVAPFSLGNLSPTSNLLPNAITGSTGDSVSFTSTGGVNGGIGTGERPFPPQSGLTYSTWICIERFEASIEESNNVRLLTILRGTNNAQEFICFQLQISAKDRALLVSTQEMPIFGDGDFVQPSGSISQDPDHNLRVWSPHHIREKQWHHIVVVLNKALLKNSTATIYIDGLLVSSEKLHYISSFPGGSGLMSNQSQSHVNIFIGTPPYWRKVSRLIWKQGPCNFFEEPLSATLVSLIYSLGPNYIGSFQSSSLVSTFAMQSNSAATIAEDKVVFGLNARATSIMTLAKMRRVYSRFDCKQISKILGLSTHENATPIYVLHNSAGHLCGPSRSLGAILIGYIGARCFVPRPVSVTIQDIGGCTLLLGLIANAQDVETLYASVKALVCVLKVNKELTLEMERIKGYQTLSMLLRRKKKFLNSHVLHLMFNLVGTLDVYKRNELCSNEINQSKAFQDLLSNQISLWAHNDLLKSLLEHFNELLFESSHHHKHQVEIKSKNLKILRELGLLPRLLQLLWDINVTDAKTMNIIKGLIFTLLNQTPRQGDLLYFGQFITALLPIYEDSERSTEHIELRNTLLKIVLKLMTTSPKPAINLSMQEELIKILGFDWFLLFLLGNSLNNDTLAIGLVNLMVLLSNQSNYTKFKEATHNGGWVKDTESSVNQKSSMQFLGLNFPSSPSPLSSPSFPIASSNRYNFNPRTIKHDIFTIPGFQYLSWLMNEHVDKPQPYLILFQGLLGQFVQLTTGVIDAIEAFDDLTSENLWNCLFGDSKKSDVSNLSCPDITLTLLSMIHTLIWEENHEKISPVTLITFFKNLYNNRKDFRNYCQINVDFINALSQVIIAEEKDSNTYCLTTHEARKHVMDFIRLIIVDSMICATNGTKPQIFAFETFLDAFSTCKLAQTELLHSLMDYLSSLTEVMSQQQHFDSSDHSHPLQQSTISNIVLFATILVDKLWQDCYLRDTKEILDFELKLLARLNPNSGKGKEAQTEMNVVYKALNRSVLYLLSRPLENISDRTAVLEALQKIHSARFQIIISPINKDSGFFACLTYCLFQLMDEEKVRLPRKPRTTWHISLDENENVPDEGALLIASVARKIWDELYLNKRQNMEDFLKVNLVPSTPYFGITSATPDLCSLRDTLNEPLAKYWMTYIETENLRTKKDRTSTLLESPSSSHPASLISEKFGKINKLTRVVGGGAGLVSKFVDNTTGAVSGAISNAVGSSIIKKEAFKTSLSSDSSTSSKAASSNWNLLPYSEVIGYTLTHISIVSELIESQMKQKCQSDSHLSKYVYDDWIQTENEFLTRERAIWGPDYGSPTLDKWKLDLTEGPNRMRKKLIKNEMFYLHYPYRPEMDSYKTGRKLNKYKVPISFDSKEYYKRYKCEYRGLLERDSIADSDTGDEEIFSPCINISQDRESSFEGLKTSSLLPIKTPSTDQDDSDTSGFVDSSDSSSTILGQQSTDCNNWEKVEAQTVLRLLEDGERISHMFRCARILGLDTYEGLLLFGKEHFYLIDGFTLLKTREIKDIDSIPSSMHDPIVPSTSPRGSICGNRKRSKKTCNKFSYEDIREVHKRRYLLQPIALEIFSIDGRNSLLVFPRKLRNKVYARFMTVATHIIDNAQESLSGQKRNVNVESGTGILSTLIGETSVTQRWMKGEISNFQYLMHLNTLAGRSYNDLMQYPVFPWVLADYTSYELDLSAPSTFRDLSKPMGAQTPERLEQFRKRYNEWDDPHNETPPYHYGTFYSSAMIVASYLVRMEPFTQYFLRLQGGHFDLADRMFHSVKDAYLSAAKNNMADVKELIPEFFYLPEFLCNYNNFDLGVKQSGVGLNDVILPPWAKGDSREFIRVHRAALECDYVSSHLHEWIDLIFGYKQQGQSAVEAINVFHHLFYEGNVDIYAIEDPLKKNATIGFINNFGQIPKQLFKKPHPAKKVFSNTSLPLTPMIQSVGLNNILLSSNSCVDKVVIHNLGNLRPLMHPIKELKGAVGQIIQQDKTLLAVEQNKVLIPSSYNRYVAWGFADHSVRIGPYESDRAIHIFESDFLPPNGEILCGTVPNSRLVITAGTSSVISVWRIKGKNYKLQLIQNLYGHTEAITCLTSSAAYGIIVSGSRDRTCIIWDLNRLLFVRQLGGGPEEKLVHSAPIAAVAINDLTGDIATCSANILYLWSINGQLLASVNTLVTGNNINNAGQALNSTTQILCVAFSLYNEWDPENIIMTGSSDGVVRIWSLQYTQIAIEDEKCKNSGSESSTMSSPGSEEVTLKDNSHLSAPPTKDEIVRRMSLASVKTESKNEDSDDSSSECEKSPEDWVTLEEEEEKHESNENLCTPNIALLKSISSEFCLIEAKQTSSEAQKLLLPQEVKPNTVNGTTTLELPKIRTSKSDTSIIDSYIIIDKTKNEAILKPGYKWEKTLIFRSKLTMHTAFERKDNTEPAAITALSMSKDNKTIFVGDARGRIFSWSVSEGRGLVDHWVKDNLAEICYQCNVKFTFSERKHHCRNCGLVFCSKCSKYEAEIPRLKTKRPVRVCSDCYLKIGRGTQN